MDQIIIHIWESTEILSNESSGYTCGLDIWTPLTTNGPPACFKLSAVKRRFDLGIKPDIKSWEPKMFAFDKKQAPDDGIFRIEHFTKMLGIPKLGPTAILFQASRQSGTLEKLIKKDIFQGKHKLISATYRLDPRIVKNYLVETKETGDLSETKLELTPYMNYTRQLQKLEIAALDLAKFSTAEDLNLIAGVKSNPLWA